MSEIEKIGPYKIVRLIGKGGMGRVYEAVNEQIQRRVAIKVLHAQFAENPLVVQRFLNEARAVNIVKHRCLVDIYEFGQLEDGAAYIIMEFLDGETLHERLWKEGGKLSMEVSIRCARQIALALAAAHAKGIIHRDLKPANIMLVEDPESGTHDWIKVLDFGLARVREPEGEAGRLTQTGVVMGTPSYMSPEQIRSARSVVDRSDVYTLGVMLYEMLSGSKPFISASDAELMFMHMSSEPRPLQEVAPGLPPALYELVHRMLKKNPSERPMASTVASSLARISGGGSSTSLPVIPSPSKAPQANALELEFATTQEAAPVQAPPTIPDSPSTAGGAAAQKSSFPGLARTRLRIAAAAGLGVLLIGGGLILLRNGIWKSSDQVSWSIRSVPAGAEVIGEGGAVLGLTPYSGQQPRRPGPQTLTLRLSGYQPAKVSCEGNTDCERETMLVTQSISPLPKPTEAAPANPDLTAKDNGKTPNGKSAKLKGDGKKKGKKPKKPK